MNHAYDQGDYNSQDYYSQGYRPSGYQSRLDAFRNAYVSQGYAAHRNSYPTQSSSDYIAGGNHNIESDQIKPHKERVRHQKPRYNHTSSRETDDYISPPIETRGDDYISQDYETTHQRTYYQDPWEQYEEPVQAPEKQMRPSRRARHVALNNELETSTHRPKRKDLERRHTGFTLGNEQEAYKVEVYENANDVAEAIRRIDNEARNAHPRAEAPRGMLRSNDPQAWNVGVYEDPNDVMDAIRRIDDDTRHARPRHEVHRRVPRLNDQGWHVDAYDRTNDAVDAIRRIDSGAQNARPRPQLQRIGAPSRSRAPTVESRSRGSSLEYDSETCVDSEAQQPSYASGSDIGSYSDDDDFSDHRRAVSPNCPGGFPSSPEPDYRTSDSSRRYASSSPVGLDDSIADYSEYGHHPRHTVAMPHHP
jgi:hypothetical protein